MGLINKTCAAIMASSWLGWACTFVMAVLTFFFFNFNLVFIYIYIIVSGNILNKSLFMHIEIAKNLLLFGKTTTVLFI